MLHLELTHDLVNLLRKTCEWRSICALLLSRTDHLTRIEVFLLLDRIEEIAVTKRSDEARADALAELLEPVDSRGFILPRSAP